ncbi:hypothetical protein F511_02028 [Dorcoceras hygrometricum]|uniref:Uncharacterized protein n=1 Tax=Dorcoceras hygrometricum TaxID=472368 RepID=A0A2Z7AWD5_9LAMI|nr:hypothetical protein F511_02028 [Dorcoceras hygrometricum]
MNQLCNKISIINQNPNHSDSAGYHDSVTTSNYEHGDSAGNHDSAIISSLVPSSEQQLIPRQIPRELSTNRLHQSTILPSHKESNRSCMKAQICQELAQPHQKQLKGNSAETDLGSPALHDQVTDSTIHATQTDLISRQIPRTYQRISNLIPARAHRSTLFPKAGTHSCSHSSNRYAQTVSPPYHTANTDQNQPASELVFVKRRRIISRSGQPRTGLHRLTNRTGPRNATNSLAPAFLSSSELNYSNLPASKADFNEQL